MSAETTSDLAYRMLKLEQQLESYQRLHSEELEQLHRAIAELKEQVLALAAGEMAKKETVPSTSDL